MTALSINLFGSVRVLLDRRRIPDLPTKKVLALLIYLAAEQSREHRREQLMTLLWPGMPERSARHNLRQTAYHLRKSLPEVAVTTPDGEEMVSFLVANRQIMALQSAAEIEVDVLRFDSLLDATREHNHIDLPACLDCRQSLTEAVEIYAGDFLADFYLDDSNEFEAWSEARREAYRRRALDALEVLTSMATRHKDYRAALAFGERQLDIDNLRESGYRQVMEILALSGRREEALGVYEKCRRLLAEEMAMEPSARTTRVYQKILEGDLTFEAPLAQGVKGYDLKEEIGQGAYGVIHRAVQTAIGRQVAIKVIRHRYANDPEFIRRFETEAQTIARLEHPFIVPLYDYWRDPEGAYLVMRYLHEGSMQDSLEKGPWEPEQTATMVEQVARALSAAHQHGVIHRDVKPGNILLDEEKNAYLSDFGIAKDLEQHANLTREGGVIGTPDYISPEQILGQEVGPQSDIYSLGAVIYEALTGEKPFPDASLAGLVHKHLNEPLPLVTAGQPELPAQIDDVIQRATAKRPADRFGDALEMAEAFRRAVGGQDLSPGVAVAPLVAPAEVYNPYKGLRAFQESDAEDFFGREALVEQLISRLSPRNGSATHSPHPQAQSRLLAVVGPSGSGKSSAVKAGLIPSLREGAISPQYGLTGSDKWFVAEMTPGEHPLEELEQALWRIAVDPPPSLVDPMQRDTRGMLRTIRRILPDEEGVQLLLVIDQFEELFTLVEDEERRNFFIDSLLAAIRSPKSPLRVVITLRADFYDRPLQVQSLGRMIKENTEVVLPLSLEELTWAVREPARRMGVRLENGLTKSIVADVADQPGALPLLQYALTELFEKRQNNVMTVSAYGRIGGVLRALGRRADEIYDALDEPGQEATRQLFLRLVTLGEGVEDTRRRVLRSELEALGNEQLTINNELLTIDSFGAARLLTFDRDPATRAPTVEVAHEALLREWGRLRGWMDESRNDIRMQRLLAQAAQEWVASGQETGFLLREARLDQFAGWAEHSTVALTGEEKEFLEASIAAREARQAEEEARRQRELETAQKLAETEHERAEEQARAAGRLRRRAVFLAGALVVAALLAAAAVFFARQSNDNAAVAENNANLASTREAEALAESEQRAIAQAEAEEQARLALSRELAAASLNELDADPERSILLALQGLAITHTLAAESALHEAIGASRVRQTFVPPGVLRSLNATYSPDGRRLFVSGESGGVLYDAQSESILYEVPSEGWINHAEFSPDGRLLALPEEIWPGNEPLPGTITILEAETGEELLTFEAHESWAQYATFSPDGRLLATGGEREVKVWDLEKTLAAGDGHLLLDLVGHEEAVWVVRFDTEGKRLATGGDSLTFVWDVASGEEILRLDIPSSDTLFSPDGTLLLTTYLETVDAWHMDSGNKAFSTLAHGNFVESMRFSPDKKSIATMSVDGTAKLFDYSNEGLEERLRLAGHSDDVRTGDFSPDGERLATASVDGTVRIWDITPHATKESIVLPNHEGPVTMVRFSPDGLRMATSSFDGTARIWDAGSGDSIHTLQGHTSRVNGVSFSPDGQMVATYGEDNKLILWEAESGREIRTIDAHVPGDVGNFFHGIFYASFSPDGTRVATAGTDGLAKIFSVEDGTELLAVVVDEQGGRGATGAIFMPDGERLVTATDEPGVVKLWDASTGEELLSLPAVFGRVGGLVVSEDGQRLIIGDSRGMLSSWRLPELDGGQDDTAGIRQLFEINAHNRSAWGLSLSPDGSLLSSAGFGGAAKLWDAETGQALLTFEQGIGVTGTAISPDGEHLATSGQDGVARVYLLDRDELVALGESRVTRQLSDEECRQFLHLDVCPE
jgi:WD40 repeat protein/serine/threonine protein kinase/DNA-binding SARP family transcriptional activator